MKPRSIRRLCYHLIVGSIVILVDGQDHKLKSDVLKPFYDACANGDFEAVKKYTDDVPDLGKAATNEGETCLHLSAISNSFKIAKLMIDLGADVNQRVTHSKGLRMTPLSWHAYGGNYEIVELLLNNGADINADFDFSIDSPIKITATDIAMNIAKKGESNSFTKTLDILISKGGKKYEELHMSDL